MPLSHILFDLDNTLYPGSAGIMQLFDTRITAYVSEVLKLDEDTARTVRHEYFTTYGTTLRGLQTHHPGLVDVEHYMTYVHELELEAILTLDRELDDMLEQIRLPKSIFTNSPEEHARRVLSALGIERHFEHMFDIRFHELEPKPSIATYHRVLDALGVPGNQLVFIEDTPQNLVPARQLGMTTILLSDDHENAASGADYVVSDILAALRVVLDLT